MKEDADPFGVFFVKITRYCAFFTTFCLVFVQKCRQKAVFEIFQKKFEKSVDNVETMWYNSQAVAERSARVHLAVERTVIEN